MQRALDLALNGIGKVSPNPMVGCVIVNNGKIIGEGWHQECGKAHAEVNAINSVREKSLLATSMLYVTLEPCAHFGKTPPCADLIVEHKIPKVVICNFDPFEKVAGKGIEKLKNAQIEVVTGVLEAKGRELNKRFFTFIEKKRPYIILKWAQTADGFVARQNFDSKWISNELSRKLVHKWRAEEDAILVGFNTAMHDNPKLNVRDWHGKNPLRIVLDKTLKLPKTHHLFADGIPTICLNTQKSEVLDEVEFIKVDFTKIENEILRVAFEKNIQSLIIEGGTKTMQGFLDKNLWDEARVFYSDNVFGDGIQAPKLNLAPQNEFLLENDVLRLYLR